ncbi:unnamed protein product [Arctogadus glacialis]
MTVAPAWRFSQLTGRIGGVLLLGSQPSPALLPPDSATLTFSCNKPRAWRRRETRGGKKAQTPRCQVVVTRRNAAGITI